MSSVWSNLENLTDLESAITLSETEDVLIFKHSTRCSISNMALSRVQKEEVKLASIYKLYFLDLLEYRNISNEIAKVLEVEHQSPQIVIVKNKKADLILNHSDIRIANLIS